MKKIIMSLFIIALSSSMINGMEKGDKTITKIVNDSPYTVKFKISYPEIPNLLPEMLVPSKKHLPEVKEFTVPPKMTDYEHTPITFMWEHGSYPKMSAIVLGNEGPVRLTIDQNELGIKNQLTIDRLGKLEIKPA